MTTLREAAQQALEALMDDQYRMVEVAGGHYEYKTDLAIGALKAALAQEQAGQEQVTYSTGALHLEAGFYSAVDLREMLKALDSMNAAARSAMEEIK